ncbi:hypothetical protein Cgig2_005358 [Carnegiea gigantea]|uniref:N-acetyltransferase domain-containing protein n=1 Tax=Carnegiea gigantea TaxID=171969 RepID=A0A9Q1QD02_9CARY|nr:hypothetical protein Cgig2_005358 [Carnegiea gigantea]
MDITLRKYQLSDVDSFMEWACDPEVLPHTSLQLRINHKSSKEDILSYLNQVVIPHPWYRAICLDSRPIGSICIEPAGIAEPHRARATLSCALGRQYWSRGIATVAARKALSDAFKELPHLNRIQAFVLPTNKASQRPLEKLGFLKEGVLRNYFTLNGQGRAKLPYASGRNYWGRGITTHVIRRSVLAAFEERPWLLRIEAVVCPNKKATLRVLEKLGLIKEGLGLLRNYMIVDGEGVDYVIYSLLSPDPMKRWDAHYTGRRGGDSEGDTLGRVNRFVERKPEVGHSHQPPVGFICIEPQLRSINDVHRGSILRFRTSLLGPSITISAIKRAVSTAIRQLPQIGRIEAFTIPNKASQRVLKKSGFLEEGLLRKHPILNGQAGDLLIFSILSADPISI